MAKITPLFKTPEHEAQDMKDYKLKMENDVLAIDAEFNK